MSINPTFNMMMGNEECPAFKMAANPFDLDLAKLFPSTTEDDKRE